MKLKKLTLSVVVAMNAGFTLNALAQQAETEATDVEVIEVQRVFK